MTSVKPDAALFDMDGLLIDSERLSLQSFLATCSDNGLADQTPLFLSIVGSNEAALMAILDDAIGQQVDLPAFRADWAQRYHALIADGQVLLKPGVEELLEWLAAEGIRMAVATSSATPIAALKLTRTGIIKRFDYIVGGDMVRHSKPHPEIFLTAAARIQADISRTLVFEDSSNGVKAGVAAGCTVLQIPDLVPPTPELLSLGHRVLDTLHDALVLLQSAEFSFTDGAAR